MLSTTPGFKTERNIVDPLNTYFRQYSTPSAKKKNTLQFGFLIKHQTNSPTELRHIFLWSTDKYISFIKTKKKPEFFIDTYTESFSDHLLNIYILTDLFYLKKRLKFMK